MDIVINENAFSQLNEFVKDYNKIALIADSAIYPHFKDYFDSLIDLRIILTSGEEAKNFNNLSSIYQKLIDHSFDKKSLILALGGGSILDLAGFIASTYQRGIDYISLPTTLLSMSDACFGGKTGVNFGVFKNYIGSFYNAKAIIIDTRTLFSLPEKEYISGIAEIIKHAVLDSSFLPFLESNSGLILNRDSKVLHEIISRSLMIKKTFFEKDFKDELGIRAKLNFGHTAGHALESLTKFNTFNHGQSVGIGMVIESYVSYLLGMLPKRDFNRLYNLLKTFFLPVNPLIDPLDYNRFIDLMKKDKKSLNETISFIAMHGFGKLELIKINDYNLFITALKDLAIIDE
jgi:3-dehydroquinate synthase